MTECGYCQYTYGKTYVEEQGFAPDKRWREGHGLLFRISDVALACAFTYLIRIRPLYK
jgi:hypothetical protein